MPSKEERPKVPKFATEAEEARWWDDHKEMVEDELIAALRDGTARRGTAQRLAQEARASKAVTIRLPAADVDRAHRLSAQKGLSYERYLKALLHEALEREDAGNPLAR